MPHDELVKIAKEAAREAVRELECGEHRCPWQGEELKDKLQQIRELPPGAWRMVRLTWNVFDRVGQIIGKAFSIGLFIFLLAILYLGGMFLLKLSSLFAN